MNVLFKSVAVLWQMEYDVQGVKYIGVSNLGKNTFLRAHPVDKTAQYITPNRAENQYRCVSHVSRSLGYFPKLQNVRNEKN